THDTNRVAKERANQGESEDGLLRFLGYYGKKNQSLRSGSALYANVFYRSLDEEFYDCAPLLCVSCGVCAVPPSGVRLCLLGADSESHAVLGYEEKGLLPWFLISTLHMWMTSV